MIGNETMFWLIHLFVGIILPFMVLSGCCRERETEHAKAQSNPQS